MTTLDSGTFVRRHAWTLLAVALAALDLSHHLFVGWVAHDEGTLALSGALVRQGLWPHRDFVDVYSGGPALLSAAAQVLFGDDLRALRYPFFLAATAWVALLAAILRRFVPPIAAAALALLAFLWGPPLYTAPLPSWYLLFLATVVLWCTLRWTETGERKWLFRAGLGIGGALLLKINALFLLAGVGSFLLADHPPGEAEGAARTREGTLVRALGLGLGVGGIIAVVLKGWPLLLALPLLLPIGALALAGVGRRWVGHESLRALVGHLGPQVIALGGGIAVVIAPLLVLYVAGGAGGALVEGVFLLPFRRATAARMFPPPARAIELLTFLTLVLACVRAIPLRVTRIVAAVIVLVGAFATFRGNADDPFFVFESWQVARMLLAGGLLLAAWAGMRRSEGTRPLLAAAYLTAWVACIQYPFAAPVYFAYVAPLAVVVLTSLVATAQVPPFVPSAVAVSAALLTLGINHGQGLNTLGFRHREIVNAPLELPHGGIEIPIREAVAYEEITELLDQWGAERIVAAPDSPEVYYLSGRPMVGREFYEFTAPRWDAGVLVERVNASRAQAVVIKSAASFSPVNVDSVVMALGARVRADTAIYRFRVLRLEAPDASP